MKGKVNNFISHIYAILLNINNSGVRDELQEMLLSCDDGMVIVTRVASMLIAIASDGAVPIGQLKLKLHGLAEHLKSPLEAVM